MDKDEALFENRRVAGYLLARRLMYLKGHHPLVLAIPRGAVPLAVEISARLKGELDVVLVHKIGSPHNEEFAIGSVSEKGEFSLPDKCGYDAEERAQIRATVAKEKLRISERRKAYSAWSRVPVQGRIVVLVDDGIATGHTMMAAIRALREEGVAKIIACAPVAPASVIESLRAVVDDLVVLRCPDPFLAVGAFYSDFSEVTDSEVMEMIAQARLIR